jgi:hypothetical protein
LQSHSHNSQNLNSFGSREECFKTRAQIMNETIMQNPSSETTRNPPESDPRAALPNAAENPIIPPTANPPPEAAIAIPSVLGRIKVLTDADRAEYLIDSAQLFSRLGTNCARKPEHASQMRPLLGLKPDQAQLAWEHAVSHSGPRKTTARLVKAAVTALQLKPASEPVKKAAGPSKAEHCRLIDSTFGELLVLLSQKAPHEDLALKVETLHRQVHALLA